MQSLQCVILWISVLSITDASQGTSCQGNKFECCAASTDDCVCSDNPVTNETGSIILINGTNSTVEKLFCKHGIQAVNVICISKNIVQSEATVTCKITHNTTYETTPTSDTTPDNLTTLPSSSSVSSVSTNTTASVKTSTEPGRRREYKGNNSNIAVNVAVPLAVAVCALAVVLLLLWRRRQKKRDEKEVKFYNTLTFSVRDHNVAVENHFATGYTVGTEYAEIQSIEFIDNQTEGKSNKYNIIDEIPKSDPTKLASYSHVESKPTVNADSNYSHVNNEKTEKTRNLNYGKVKGKLVKVEEESPKKEPCVSYDTIALSSVSKEKSKAGSTKLTSEYSHSHSNGQTTLEQNKPKGTDEYSHLDYKPKPDKFDASKDNTTVDNIQIRKGPSANSEQLSQKTHDRNEYLELQSVVENTTEDNVEESVDIKAQESDNVYGKEESDTENGTKAHHYFTLERKF